MHKNQLAKEQAMEPQDPQEESLKGPGHGVPGKSPPGAFRPVQGQTQPVGNPVRRPPQIVDGFRVQFRVINELQKTWIERTLRAAIDTYLRKSLHDKRICMSGVEEIWKAPPSNTCYMPEEKARFIAEKIPRFAALGNDLNLDIS